MPHDSAAALADPASLQSTTFNFGDPDGDSDLPADSDSGSDGFSLEDEVDALMNRLRLRSVDSIPAAPADSGATTSDLDQEEASSADQGCASCEWADNDSDSSADGGSASDASNLIAEVDVEFVPGQSPASRTWAWLKGLFSRLHGAGGKQVDEATPENVVTINVSTDSEAPETRR